MVIKGDEFWNVLQATKESCDKECSKCEMFVKTKNRCIHEDMKLYKKWLEKRHAEFGKTLKGE